MPSRPTAAFGLGVSAPATVGTDNDWTAVSAGLFVGAFSGSQTFNWVFILALNKDGCLWSWGANQTRQLGIGTSEPFRTTPTRLGTDKDWKEIAAGAAHSIARKSDGSLWGWAQTPTLASWASPRIEPTRTCPPASGSATISVPSPPLHFQAATHE